MKPLLIPLTYFCLQTWLGIPQAKCQVELSMMDDAFDDQYIGCAEEMDGIAPELLEKEKSMSSVFSRVWENSEQKWELVKKKIPLPTGFKDEHGRAIIAYTDDDFHSELNAAVRGAGTSRAHYMASFPFKAFHYYLTRASQLLRGRCDVMYKRTVYRGVSASFQHTGSGHIRFGYFASSSFDIGIAKTFGTDTLFAIHTCFGAEIRAFSRIQEEEEVLIPVHEIFNMSRGQRNNRFVLRSTNRTCSHFNCAYLGGEYWAEHEKYLCGAIFCGEFENSTSGRADERDAELGTCPQGWGRQAAMTLAAREGSGWGGWTWGPTRSLRKEKLPRHPRHQVSCFEQGVGLDTLRDLFQP
ncbi:ecto-ADP-ribosyltransferase 5-like isoform X1 [Malaclemys terrapin pileata]|uniref:ecto-ADP-ribosyltransferase 5-like isoform X1 n=1 Tax=Malaclemys terrapin pileata TaxID=2991368 RepID=UPI0023A8AE25|nr:ecto-ADP-ribosyltransferase 5-like isoform X1 [Malaclemys terrapin pileata]XP_053871918.1 ecto-ADP-ribosyltransferase 5-like isoform X1 [Malaclemys terrapin pileata]XP_053871919.1 ecto-ADP-ribosyltransferase 5-like isoform X1 [Malaclemys terrapin pileata]